MAIHLLRDGIFALMIVVLGAYTAQSEETAPLHRSLQGTVVEKGGALAVKVPDGTVYQLNPNRSH